MNTTAYILAADDFEWLHIVALLVFVGIGAIGSFFKNQAEKNKQRKKLAKPKTAPPLTVDWQARAQNQQTQAQARAQAQDAVRVGQELKLRQQRQTQIEGDRQKRMATRTPPEANTKAIETHMVGVQASQQKAEVEQIGQIGQVISLQARTDAEKAMILHEIFSKPKALRTDSDERQ